MASKKTRKKQVDLTKAVSETARIISGTTKQVTEKALEIAGTTKGLFAKDVEDLAHWVEKRNQDIKSERYEINPDTLPTLAKVISGGEAEISRLPEEDKKKYTDYFKRNASRITVLTAINPLIGIGTAGAEMAASGLISTKASVGAAATGAGILGVSLVASPILPLGGFAWSVGSLLSYLGVGLFAFGGGATLFKSVEKLPQGKLIADVFDKTKDECNKCCEQIESNLRVIDELLSEKVQIAVDALQSTSKKIAITIDDAVHSDQNMRIMQYQQIVLDQYNSQITIQQELSELVEKYNAIRIENERLTKQVVEYRNNMQQLICGSEYLK